MAVPYDESNPEHEVKQFKYIDIHLGSLKETVSAPLREQQAKRLSTG
jgi:hypothetical protein